MQTVLLAGGTGYLGNHLWQQLLDSGYKVRALVRHPGKVDPLRKRLSDVRQTEITQPAELAGCCDQVDVVISSLGITRQRDGLTYMDVDYQANLNLLDEARRSGVKQFIYVSVLNGERFRHLKICAAKERFVDALKQSGLNYRIIRPNGFYSDLGEFVHMAQKGCIYLFGDGEYRTNPIHGTDLAKAIVEQIDQPSGELPIGGPQTLTHNDIARLAFAAAGKPVTITYIPNWLRQTALLLLRKTTSVQTYGPMEFFMTVMAANMLAPECGEKSLESYFNQLNSERLDNKES